MRRLRPMGIADILDEAVDLYRSNFVLLVGTAAVLLVPWFLAMGIYSQRLSTSRSDKLEVAAVLVPFLVFFLVITPVVTSALSFAISERYLDRRATIGSSYARVLRPGTFLSLLGAIILKLLLLGLAMFGGGVLMGIITLPFREAGPGSTTALVIGTILSLCAFAAVVAPVWIRLAVVESSLIVERLGSRGAVKRSWGLMTGFFWKGFWLTLIVLIVWTLLLLIVTGPTQWIILAKLQSHQQVSQAVLTVDLIIEVIVRTLLAPIGSIVTVLLYYDIRIRKEGFDLEMLASDLDARARELPAGVAAALPQEQFLPQPPTEGP